MGCLLAIDGGLTRVATRLVLRMRDELPRDRISCPILSLLLRNVHPSSHLGRFLDLPGAHQQSLNACRLVRLLGRLPLIIILGSRRELEGMLGAEGGRSCRADV